MAARGLKTKMTINIALLLLISAVLTDILVLVVVLNVMVRHEVDRSSTFIQNMGRLFFQEFTENQLPPGSYQRRASVTALSQSAIPVVMIVDLDGNLLYHRSSRAYPDSSVSKQVEAARRGGKAAMGKVGSHWVLFGWRPKAIALSVPIVLPPDRMTGAVGALVPLATIYDSLRKYHRAILLYILINTVILTIVGFYRIFKLYLRPIDRIVRQADDFHEDEDVFFAFRHEDNELNRLSSSLNRMITRISRDKKKLQATVISLEQANLDLQNAQKKIIRAEKMASIGRLAAGIAHEIGNPIGIVLGYLDMLKQDGLEDEDKSDFLRRAGDEVQRINTVIRQLLDLARPGETRDENVNVNEVIRDIVEVMQLQPVMNDIQLEMDLLAQDDTIWGHGDQLRQVFLNLLLNAADAIKSGDCREKGRIRVNTSNLDEGGDFSNAILQVRFEDNGCGITPHQIQDIFDPFYTTKEPGKGTGLGLAVSYMIVESMGGTITADNRPEGGAMFVLELPIADE